MPSVCSWRPPISPVPRNRVSVHSPQRTVKRLCGAGVSRDGGHTPEHFSVWIPSLNPGRQPLLWSKREARSTHLWKAAVSRPGSHCRNRVTAALCTALCICSRGPTCSRTTEECLQSAITLGPWLLPTPSLRGLLCRESHTVTITPTTAQRSPHAVCRVSIGPVCHPVPHEPLDDRPGAVSVQMSHGL